MKKIFYGSIVLAMTISLNLQAETVILEDSTGECPGMEIASLTNLSSHTTIEGIASINEGWDSDKYMFTPENEGTVILNYKADVPISVKIDYECGGSGIYRKADDAALKENSIEIPVSADQTIHIGTWDWESGNGYPYTLNVEFIPVNNNDTNDTDNNSTEENSGEEENIFIADVIIYEDAQDGNINGWINIEPYTGIINNVTTTEGKVIELSGTTNSAKHYASYSFGENWNNTQNFIAQWDLESDTNYEIFFIATSNDDPNIVNYIGYVSEIPSLTGYSFNASTGYWVEDSTAQTMYDWGRYVYNILENTASMNTITRNLKEDASSSLGIDLISINSMWVNVYGDSTHKVILDNIMLKRTITPEQNHPPVAFDQNITIKEGETITITLNANDEDEDNLLYEIIDQPTLGEVTDMLPNLIYTAYEVDQNSTDTIKFKAKDDENESNEATITINIIDIPQPENQAPTASDINVSVDQNQSIIITLLGNDPEENTLSYYIVQEPLYGTLNGTAPNLTYYPDINYTGSDTFSYKVSDGDINSSIASVTIIVNEVANEQNSTTEPEIISIDENSSIESNCAGQIIDTPDINQTIEIRGTLNGQWDDDKYSFILQDGNMKEFEAYALDANANALKIQVIENCFKTLPKIDNKYSTNSNECGLVTIIVYGCTDGEDIDYTLTLKMLN